MRHKIVGSADLHIDLSSKSEEELFKWFLASLLFGKPIQQDVAAQTYKHFVEEGINSPVAIQEAGWDKLVRLLDKGHYVRYDFSRATKLLDISKELLDKCESVGKLIQTSGARDELARRMDEFKGIGAVTARIFTDGIEGVGLYRPTRD